MTTGKLRKPSNLDMENADRWLSIAQQELKSNEYWQGEITVQAGYSRPAPQGV